MSEWTYKQIQARIDRIWIEKTQCVAGGPFSKMLDEMEEVLRELGILTLIRHAQEKERARYLIGEEAIQELINRVGDERPHYVRGLQEALEVLNGERKVKREEKA